MRTTTRFHRASRRTSRTARQRGRPAPPAAACDRTGPTETFYRAGRIAAVPDDGRSSPLGRAASAVIVWLAVYGLLVSLTLAFSGSAGA